jgi:hypothetical protein
MPAANMREDGVRSISATCETCQHEAVLNADRWPADMPVPGRLQELGKGQEPGL